MDETCEVALPVPLDRTFTYALRDGQRVERGSRVVAPFRNEKLIGIVVGVGHGSGSGSLEFDGSPGNTASGEPAEKSADFELRYLEAVLDEEDGEPVLNEGLLKLGEWMASYYLAPLGEVLRGMLPLMAEVKRTVYYRITDLGRDALAGSLDGDGRGAGRGRGKLSREELDLQFRVLQRLASGEPVKVSTLRTATSAGLPVLASMLRKKWIARETSAVERDARRMERFAVLVPEARIPALTAKQQAILAELAACGGETPLTELRAKGLPHSTLQTLVRRGLVRIDERPAAFRLGGIEPGAAPDRLNEPQMDALASIASSLGQFRAFLFYGVTGSGKTAVYLAAMQRALDRGMSAILLVPEIGLTPQTVGLLDAAFGNKVALLHSALTPEERSEQWRRIRRGEAPVVVGTRSAVFAPAPNLGLILVDEEHDQSYKQEETPRYNARDVAVMRAKLSDALVVLGSATPSLESWQNAAQGKYTRIEMKERVMNRPLPEVELVDMRVEFKQSGQESLFSRSLIEQTRAALDRGEQALILLNRRGYSFVAMCRACGAKLDCQNCAIALTHHKAVGEEEIAQRGTAAGVSLLRLSACGAGLLSKVRIGAPLLPRGRLAAGRGAIAGDLSRGAYRAHGSRYGSRPVRPGAPPGASACRRDQSAGGHADDRERARHPRRNPGGRGGLRSRAEHAGFSRRGAGVPVDDTGERASGPRRTARARSGADVLSGSLCDHSGNPARLLELCRARAQVPAMDALPAVWRAGQCAGAIGQTGGSGCLVSGAGPLVPEGGAGRRARAGTVYGAAGAYQKHLPFSFNSEGRLAQAAERGPARHAGPRGRGERATTECGGGCGCTKADVRCQRSWRRK